MTQFRVNISEEATDILDTLVDIFASSRSNIIEELILDYSDDFAQARRAQLDAWIKDMEEDEEEYEDPEEDEEEF